MKPLRFLSFIIVFAALGALAWRVFQHEEKHEEEEAKPVTEVAVKVGKLTRTTLHRTVNAYAVIEPAHATKDRPAAMVQLAVPSEGLIGEVLCAEGQEVKKGDVLLKLDTRTAEAKMQESKKALEFAEQQSDRQKKLLTVDGTSIKAAQEADAAVQKARLEIASAQTALSLLQVAAPISGVITELSVRAGEAAQPGKTVIEIVDASRLVARAEIPNIELADATAGKAVTLLRNGKALASSGAVVFVSPQVNVQTGTAEVLVSIPADAGLRAGEWIGVSIIVEEKKDCLAAPLASVVKTEEGEQVIAIVHDGQATQIPVKAGVSDGDLIEVEGEGLKEGDVVVTVGAYGLPKETKVKVLEEAGAADKKEEPKPAKSAAASLELKQSIALPGVKGGFDLMAADVAGQRLFVCAQDNHTLEVIDLKAGKPLRGVSGFSEPKWVVYRPETGVLYVATAGDGKVTALDATSFKVIKEFQFREKCNNLRFDLVTKELFVGVGKTFGALGIIDTSTNEIAGEIKLASFPKQFELEGNLIYVNVPQANHIAVVDRAKREVIATWPVKEAKDNVPMGFDRAHKRLLIACDPGKFVVFDTDTGKSVAGLDISEGADGVHYDAKRSLVYISCGAGFIEVIKQSDADHYSKLEKIATAKNAGTSLFVPELDRLILAVPQHDQQAAELRIYQPKV